MITGVLFGIISLPVRILRSIFCHPCYRFEKPCKGSLSMHCAPYDGSIMSFMDKEHPSLSMLLMVLIGGAGLAVLLGSAVLGFPFG